jgi:hypothetical protein
MSSIEEILRMDLHSGSCYTFREEHGIDIRIDLYRYSPDVQHYWNLEMGLVCGQRRRPAQHRWDVVTMQSDNGSMQPCVASNHDNMLGREQVLCSRCSISVFNHCFLCTTANEIWAKCIPPLRLTSTWPTSSHAGQSKLLNSAPNETLPKTTLQR